MHGIEFLSESVHQCPEFAVFRMRIVCFKHFQKSVQIRKAGCGLTILYDDDRGIRSDHIRGKAKLIKVRLYNVPLLIPCECRGARIVGVASMFKGGTAPAKIGLFFKQDGLMPFGIKIGSDAAAADA
jgi:hypothetical protein